MDILKTRFTPRGVLTTWKRTVEKLKEGHWENYCGQTEDLFLEDKKKE